MIGAALLAKKAVERGLARRPWVKTTLAPGSEVVMDYDDRAELGIFSITERSQPTLPGIDEEVEQPTAPTVTSRDAPMCMQCGVVMVRAGSCHACPSCGSTSGCS